MIGIKDVDKQKYVLYGLGDQEVSNYGCKNIDICIGKSSYNLEVQITDCHHKAYDGLLGLDFLLANRAKLDVDVPHTLEIGGEIHLLTRVEDVIAKRVNVCRGVINLKRSQELTSAVIRLTDPVHVPPGRNKIVFVPVPKNMPRARMYVVHPLSENEVLDDKRCYVARSVRESLLVENRYCVPVLFTNYNDAAAKLTKGTPVGELQIIDESEVISIGEEVNGSTVLGAQERTSAPSEEEKHALGMKRLRLATAARIGSPDEDSESSEKGLVETSQGLEKRSQKPAGTAAREAPVVRRAMREEIESTTARSGVRKEEEEKVTERSFISQEENTLPVDYERFRDTGINPHLLYEKLNHLSDRDAQKFRDLVYEFREIFENTRKKPAPTTAYHRINTTDDIPVKKRGHRIPPHLQPHVDNIIEDQINRDIITQCYSPYGAGMVLVPKKTADGEIKYRLTIDFRFLNAKTIEEVWPTPLVNETINSLAGCNYFSLLDLKEAYHQIPIHPDDQEKTAYSNFNISLFEKVSMYKF